MLIIKTVGVADIIRSVLKPCKNKITQAFIYGSFASGEYGNESDVYLFVVSELPALELTKIMGPVQEEIGRPVNIAHFGPDEFESRQSEREHFVTRVLEGPRIELNNETSLHLNFGKNTVGFKITKPVRKRYPIFYHSLTGICRND